MSDSVTNDKQPEYVPAAVWRFYLELKQRGHLSPREMEVIKRLFGLDMEKTWRNLKCQVQTTGNATAEQDWRYLFDFLYNMAFTFDTDARDGMRQARDLLSEVEAAASTLANLLAKYHTLRDKHELSAPDEFGMLLKWIHNTAREEPRPVFQMITVEELGFPKPGAIDLKYLPDPVAMIKQLGRAAAEHNIECFNETSTHIDDRQIARDAPWIRHFDARWRAGQRQGLIAARLHIGDTDLARIASAVLGLEVSPQTVHTTRRRSNV